MTYFSGGYFCQVNYCQTAWIMYISQICDLARSRFVDWFFSLLTWPQQPQRNWNQESVSFFRSGRPIHCYWSREILNTNYQYSMRYFRGRSRSEETLSWVTNRRIKTASGQRLTRHPAVVCGWTTDSWHQCIVALLHALFYQQICVTLLRYSVTCTRAWFSSIWFKLRSDRQIICVMRR